MRIRSVAALILAAILVLPMTVTAKDAATEPLYIIERDTLQTRNFTPIINHEILLVNIGAHPLELEIHSAIPAGKYVKGPHYPAFLEESLLPDPMFSPIEVAPTKTSYLPKPAIESSGENTAMVWKGVTLSAGEAAIAQYDNYYGEPSLYFAGEGLDIQGLKIRTHYTAETRAGERILIFSYEIENSTANSIDDLAFDTFIPLKIVEGTPDIILLDLKEIAFSPNVIPTQVTRTDGFGRAAAGVSATLWSENLPARGKVRFFLKLSGAKTPADQTLWPLLTLRGRCLTKSVWPTADIKVKQHANIGRFAYLSYNLILQDSRVLKLSNRGIKIMPAGK